jgi:endonuclease-8
MPEGPEIRRAADELAEVLARRVAVRVEFGLPALKKFEAPLSGQRIAAVESRGKALLLHFADDVSVYTHNQLYGRWKIVAAGKRPQTTRQLRLAIDTRGASALLYSASDISVSTRAALAEHPYIAGLGVELLASETTVDTVRAQCRSPNFQRRALGGLLLDQGFLAGIGNYLRSDILFAAQVRPERRLGDLTEEERGKLATAAFELTHRSYRSGGITNDLARAARLKKSGLRFGRYRHLVFDREGERCWTCGATVLRTLSAGRNLFLCPQCQT